MATTASISDNSRAASIPEHMPALDGLRGLAILLVLLIHCGQGWSGALQVFQNTETLRSMFLEPAWVQRLTDGGASGVQLFFIVSAYTLTIQAVRRKNDSKIAYAARRLARIGPAFWLAATGYGIIAGFGPRTWAPDGITTGTFLAGVAFLSSWLSGPSLAVVPGGWSVSCEIAFYLALPALLFVISGRVWRAAALTAVALLVAQARAMHALKAGIWDFEAYVNPI